MDWRLALIESQVVYPLMLFVLFFTGYMALADIALRFVAWILDEPYESPFNW